MNDIEQVVDLEFITLDREKPGDPITVDFVNATNNAWILRVEVFGVEDTGLTIQWAQIKQDTVDMFLDVIQSGADLMNKLHSAGANTYKDVLSIVQDFCDDLDWDQDKE